MDRPEFIDVATRNYDVRLVDEEILKYPPGSKESIALCKLKERLAE